MLFWAPARSRLSKVEQSWAGGCVEYSGTCRGAAPGWTGGRHTSLHRKTWPSYWGIGKHLLRHRTQNGVGKGPWGHRLRPPPTHLPGEHSWLPTHSQCSHQGPAALGLRLQPSLLIWLWSHLFTVFSLPPELSPQCNSCWPLVDLKHLHCSSSELSRAVSLSYTVNFSKTWNFLKIKCH